MNSFPKLCRLCTNYVGESLTLNHSDSDHIIFRNKLSEIVPEILKEPNNILPNFICALCIVQLNDAYKFRLKCIHSQQILKQYLIKGVTKTDSAQMCEENEQVKSEMCCDNFGKELNLQLVNSVDEFNNSESCVQLQNNKFIQDEVEENKIKLEENIKEEQIDDNSEKESSYFYEEHNSDEIYTEFVDIKDEIIDVSGDETVCEVFPENIVTNEYITQSGSTLERCYKCVICEEVFNNQLELNSHGRKHKQNKGYNCKWCDKYFKPKSSLLRHVRIHTNEKPYVCEICKKAFSESGNLTRHIRLHAKKKAYKCNVCDKSYTMNQNLKRHILTHTYNKANM